MAKENDTKHTRRMKRAKQHATKSHEDVDPYRGLLMQEERTMDGYLVLYQVYLCFRALNRPRTRAVLSRAWWLIDHLVDADRTASNVFPPSCSIVLPEDSLFGTDREEGQEEQGADTGRHIDDDQGRARGVVTEDHVYETIARAARQSFTGDASPAPSKRDRDTRMAVVYLVHEARFVMAEQGDPIPMTTDTPAKKANSNSNHGNRPVRPKRGRAPKDTTQETRANRWKRTFLMVLLQHLGLAPKEKWLTFCVDGSGRICLDTKCINMDSSHGERAYAFATICTTLNQSMASLMANMSTAIVRFFLCRALLAAHERGKHIVIHDRYHGALDERTLASLIHAGAYACLMPTIARAMGKERWLRVPVDRMLERLYSEQQAHTRQTIMSVWARTVDLIREEIVVRDITLAAATEMVQRAMADELRESVARCLWARAARA